jgi:crotonobetainyl-CoA:carnitine CoA-transferase CaiB-like acyl-CoA transferase
MVAPVALSSLGERVTRKGNRHQFFAPVAVHRTRDGHVYLAIGNDQQWAALTALPAFSRLARAEYTANAGRIGDVERLDHELAACFAGLSSDEALESLRRAGVPVSRVNTLADVMVDRFVADSWRSRTRARGSDRAAGPPVGAAGAQLSAPTRRAQ